LNAGTSAAVSTSKITSACFFSPHAAPDKATPRTSHNISLRTNAICFIC
jgi:hypothetical protein